MQLRVFPGICGISGGMSITGEVDEMERGFFRTLPGIRVPGKIRYLPDIIWIPAVCLPDAPERETFLSCQVHLPAGFITQANIGGASNLFIR